MSKLKKVEKFELADLPKEQDAEFSSNPRSEKPLWVEPKMSFRFKIRFKGLDIPDFLFRKYKMYNEAEKLIFETSIYETIDFSLNPTDFFKILEIELIFVDATGKNISSWEFFAEGISFETEGDYGKSDIMFHNFKFEVNKKTFKLNKLI